GVLRVKPAPVCPPGPHPLAAPGEAGVLRVNPASIWPPSPHSLVALRRSRGVALTRPRYGPYAPTRSSPPGGAGVLRVNRAQCFSAFSLSAFASLTIFSARNAGTSS